MTFVVSKLQTGLQLREELHLVKFSSPKVTSRIVSIKVSVYSGCALVLLQSLRRYYFSKSFPKTSSEDMERMSLFL